MKFDVGTKVELLPDKEEVYLRAVALSRGTVTRVKEDDFGYDKVYIVWDKEHWRYNGEEDGWTYAEHFRALDEHEIIDAESYDVPNTIPREDEGDKIAEYLDALMVAADKAAESNGFFLITMKRDGMGLIRLDVLGASTDDDLLEFPTTELFRFVEQEMRRKEDEDG